jgi:hypothetical protein
MKNNGLFTTNVVKVMYRGEARDVAEFEDGYTQVARFPKLFVQAPEATVHQATAFKLPNGERWDWVREL